MSKKALICGSLAFDTIMVFGDRFRHHILPDKIHMLNVSFLVPQLRREFGGCAGNIAYNLKLHIATQFTFDAEAIIAWDERLTHAGITLPAHIGIAGPTPLPKLVKYAMACGVGASLNSVMKNMTAMAKLARLATTPDEMLTGLVRGGAARGSSRIVQPHFYAFGGVAATARWIRAVIDGRFTLEPDSDRFALDA